MLEPAGVWMVVRNFVSESERQQLLGKAHAHAQAGELQPNPCGPGRFYAKVDDEPLLFSNALLDRLTRRCARCLRLTGVPSDCALGRIISLIAPGGCIHGHTDKYIEGQPGHRPGLEHVRCNIVVRLRDPSGRPVIEDTALPVEERDLWVFTASKSRHETRPLQGRAERIVYGFGWSVPPSYALREPPDGWGREDG